MKKQVFAIIISVVFAGLASCKKDSAGQVSNAADESLYASTPGLHTARIGGSGDTIPILPFGILGLANGTFTINSGTTLIGNVGYSAGDTSPINQKLTTFQGSAFVHSNVADFIYKPVTFAPTLGIQQNSASVDQVLDDANTNAQKLSGIAAALPVDINEAILSSSKSFNSIGHNTVIHLTSVSYNSDMLTLNGTYGADDGFIINVDGNFDFAQSEIRLNNVRPERILFNFPNASSITVNKASSIFKGTILAPKGDVIYHNPASFEGAIIAKNIAVHSAFNLTQKPFYFSQAVTP